MATTREQIHEAACRLFRERGFHATSVRDIAEAVGIQGGSLYTHIKGKDDLLWEIVDAAADRFFAALEPIVSSKTNVMGRLKKAIIAHVSVVAGDLNAAAVYTVEWRHLSDERKSAITARRDAYEKLFRSLVSEAIHERHLTPTDAAGATLFILSSLNFLFTWYKPEGRMSSHDIGVMLSDFIFDGLKRRTV
ncbi:MAG: TetR family transcriptional regulator [Planctomycetes bacterium]|nr:TetR family transcriptional regulator [Planctomycetota bacterium]